MPLLTYIIVPVYNESRHLGRFLDELLAIHKRVIVVDDGSTDQTGEIASRRGVICLTHLVNLGKGAALKTGCRYAFSKLGADAVVIMDGDGQHDPSDLPAFLRELKLGADIVLGVRRLDSQMPLMRILGNKGLSILINLLFGRYLSDIPSGFKALSKRAYRTLKWQSSGYEVETEIAVRIAQSRLAYIELPISTLYLGKDHGFNLLDAWRILIRIPYWLWR